MGKYDDKTIVITGGTSGFGLASARHFISEGARVLVTGRTQSGLDSASALLGHRAHVVKSDISSSSDVDALVERAAAEFGAVDLLFVNSGITRFVPFELTMEEVFDEIFAINTKGPYFAVQKFAPLMRDGGAVVLTTSVANERGFPMVSAYAASKAALRSMTRSLAAEFLPRKIRVNALSPGPIDTGILDKVMNKEQAEETKASMAKDNPMGRFGELDEIVKAVVYLGFDATYTTGTELVVDGGQTQI
jgi:NAD(P)-dependent dehydrogenase (short-subunit alcohol dehydrogenase family)